MNILERRDATQKTLDWFATRPFDWRKSATCVHLVRRQLIHLGHKPPPMKSFRSALSAKRALKEKGWADLTEMMNSVLPRIAPARAIVGDIVELPSEHDTFGALCVATGNGRIMGYLGDEGGPLTVMQPLSVPLKAWRA